MSEPESQNPYHTPTPEIVAEPVPGYPGNYPSNEADATGGVIPYKNPHALIAYYLGIVSLLPLIGVPFGLASVILGFMGLSRRKKNPVIKGSVHAWIGIVCGMLSMLCGGGLLTMMFTGAVIG